MSPCNTHCFGETTARLCGHGDRCTFVRVILLEDVNGVLLLGEVDSALGSIAGDVDA